jgi:zinc protease
MNITAAGKLCLLALLASFATAQAADIDIPYRMEVLENGLTVIVHEDRKAPVVAVNIWYHVGSKNEVRGRTGFAHLFEHLMFQGTENFNDEYLTALEGLGATNFNATTWYDRTNYFQTVPNNNLDGVLWLESDRMGHFLGAITQAKLDEQRGVVQNEKRQGDNQPYGRVWEYIDPALFPPEHPYSWETIGSMEDLNAATLEDVRTWFRTWYGPNNAVLAIAGDVSADEAFAKARKFFGDIPAVAPVVRPGKWIPRHTGTRRMTMQDRVPQARMYQAWTGPNWGTADAQHLAIAAEILAGSKNSRLYQRLVYRDRLASDVSMGALALEMAGITYLQASAQPGVDLATIEAAVDEELQLFRRKGPTRRELQRAVTQFRAGFLRGIEQVGGFSGKAGILAESMVLGGSPDAWKKDLALLDSATPDAVRRAAAEWVGQGSFILNVVPYPALNAAATGADRSGLPASGPPPQVGFPGFERATLANGLDIMLAPRPGTGLIELQLILEGGFAADPASRPGTTSLAMGMLDEGTTSRSALEISEQLALLGATLGTGAGLDTMSVGLSALRENLEPTLSLFADVILNPTFPQQELERVRGIHLAGLRQEKNRPNSMALRVLPKLIYGAGHPYARPLTGTGTEASISSLTRDELASFHATWFRSDHATLVAAGDITMAELRPMVEKLFAQWQPGEIPTRKLSAAQGERTDVLYFLDRPGADQSVIFVGQTLPPRANPDEFALQRMNDILGGQISARINMNLREDKHWSYGAYSSMMDARGERPYFVYAPVQTDKTAEALRELRGEMQGIVGSRPVTAVELDRAKTTEVLSLAGRWETAGAVAGALSEIVRFDLPPDYWSGYAAGVSAVTLADVDRVARTYIRPDRQIYVVVGDRARTEIGLRALGFSEIRLIDADGEAL